MELSAEDEVHRAEDTQRSPQIIQLHRLVHVENGEGDKHHQRDHLLHDLELRQRQGSEADAVRRHLKEVLEQSDAPAGERGDPPGLRRQVLQMRIPGERHEHVRCRQHERRQRDGRKLSHGIFCTACPASLSRASLAVPMPGMLARGAISSSGSSTNARSCMRGCGSVSRSVLTCSFSKSSRSRSSVRGAFAKERCRPCRDSSACSSSSSRSAGIPVSSCATAFTKSGCSVWPSGGDRESDERATKRLSGSPSSPANARVPCCVGSSRFEPMPTNAIVMSALSP